MNESIFHSKGVTLGEDNTIILKSISEEDYENYMRISYYNSSIKKVFDEFDNFNSYNLKKDLWETFISDECAYYSIYKKITGEFIGYCGIKDITKQIWELGMELKPEYRNLGYGYLSLQIMMKQIYNKTGIFEYQAKVNVDNYSCQGLMKKMSAIPHGITELWLRDEYLIKYQKMNAHLINDDNIKRLAVEFNVRPIDLIGRVLIYKIIYKN